MIFGEEPEPPEDDADADDAANDYNVCHNTVDHIYMNQDATYELATAKRDDKVYAELTESGGGKNGSSSHDEKYNNNDEECNSNDEECNETGYLYPMTTRLPSQV